MFGFQRRFVRRCECETLIPQDGPFPQSSQTAAMVQCLPCLLRGRSWPCGRHRRTMSDRPRAVRTRPSTGRKRPVTLPAASSCSPASAVARGAGIGSWHGGHRPDRSVPRDPACPHRASAATLSPWACPSPTTPLDLLSRRGRGATSSVIRDLLHLTNRSDVLSLAGGLPSPDSFPVGRLRESADAVLAGAGRYGPEAIQYGPTEGIPALRQWVADTYAARGGECRRRGRPDHDRLAAGPRPAGPGAGRRRATTSWSRLRRTSEHCRRWPAPTRTWSRSRPTGTACAPICSRSAWPPACGPASATSWPTSRTPRGARWPSIAVATSPRWPTATGS